MALFKKKAKKEGSVMASAPEEPETEGETKHIAALDKAEAPAPVAEAPAPQALPEPAYGGYPVSMSQNQINNLVIENNIMLKELMAMANEE